MTTTYVFGAGASFHAGYPFVKDMGGQLSQWMSERDGYPLLPYRATVEALKESLGDDLTNIESVLNKIERRIRRGAPGYNVFASVYKPALVQAMREWFADIQQRDNARAYRLFAERVIRPGDSVITFNYDVSLDRELRRANLWTLGDGYGFPIEPFVGNSPVTIFKLHGSINWIAGLFAGLRAGQCSAVGPNGAFGTRPIFCDRDLTTLGYDNQTDPQFPRDGIAFVLPMILPTHRKQFYFDTNLGREWKGFWDSLWRGAKKAIRNSSRVVICGYGMYPVDRRGCTLLLGGKLSARFEVCCSGRTNQIVEQLRGHGRTAQPSNERTFEKWVEAKIAKGI